MKKFALTLIALLVAAASFAQVNQNVEANLTGPGAPTAAPQELRPTDEVQKLKAENLSMKQALLRQQVQELQRQVQEAGQKLDADWKALEGEMRAALKVPTDYTFDRQKGAFVPATAPPAPATGTKEPGQ